MKRLLLSLLLLASAPAHAQVGFGGMIPGPGTPHTAGAYVGPGDVVATARGWWGFRAYTTATMGTKALNVCLPSDTACADVNTDAVTGLVPNTVTISGSTCNNSTVQCTIKTLYDKSGNALDFTQATIANRLNFTVSCTGLTASTPCGTAAGGANYTFANTVNQGTSPNYTWTCAAKRTSAFTSSGECISYYNGSFLSIGYLNSTNTAYFYSGGGGSATNSSATDNAWHALIGRGDLTTPVLYMDGTSSNAPNASSTILDGTGTIALMRDGDGSANPFTGTFFEAGLWLTQFTPTQASNMNSNMHAGGGY